MEFSRNLFEYGHRIEGKNPFLDASCSSFAKSITDYFNSQLHV